MTVLCPASFLELRQMLHWAIHDCTGPVAVRYPRGTEGDFCASDWQPNAEATIKCHRKGRDVTLITYGTMCNNVIEAADLLAQQGIVATVLRLMSVSPLPVKQIADAVSLDRPVVVVEEVCSGSGICQELAWKLQNTLSGCCVHCIDLGHEFSVQGDMASLYKYYGLDAASIAEYVREAIKHEN